MTGQLIYWRLDHSLWAALSRGFHAPVRVYLIGPVTSRALTWLWGEWQEEGVNWLQLHWEHLAFLSEKKLAIVRDTVLQALALHCHVLKATSEAAALQRAYVSCGALKISPMLFFKLYMGTLPCQRQGAPAGKLQTSCRYAHYVLRSIARCMRIRSTDS